MCFSFACFFTLHRFTIRNHHRSGDRLILVNPYGSSSCGPDFMFDLFYTDHGRARQHCRLRGFQHRTGWHDRFGFFLCFRYFLFFRLFYRRSRFFGLLAGLGGGLFFCRNHRGLLRSRLDRFRLFRCFLFDRFFCRSFDRDFRSFLFRSLHPDFFQVNTFSNLNGRSVFTITEPFTNRCRQAGRDR